MFAAALDGFQFLFSTSLFILGAAAGATLPLTGATAGAVLGCIGGGALAGLGALAGGIGAIPGLAIAGGSCAAAAAGGFAVGSSAGGAAAATIVPLGIILGFVVNACLSLTFGIGLITLLGFEGMFFPLTIVMGIFGETIPVFDNLPIWTGLVLICAFKKLKEERGTAGKAAQIVGAILTPSAGSVAGAARAVDGIRHPANDNEPYAQAA